MSRLAEAFGNKNVFVGFLTAGDPTIQKTEEFIVEMANGGAGVIEIGIPFSDPIAEGPMVQDANVRALSAPGGCTTDTVFDMIERVRDKVTVPFVLLTYLNPVFKYGYDRFFKRCKEVGVDGIIIPDMPYEERGELLEPATEYGVDIISLIAPTSEGRIEMIAKEAQGYIYLMSSMGVEGIENETNEDIEKKVAEIKKYTKLPVVVSYGMGVLDKVSELPKVSDGIIIDSAIVQLIAKHGEEAGAPVREYIKGLTAQLG